MTPRIDFGDRALKEFRKTAVAVSQPPWSLLKAQAWLEQLCDHNQSGVKDTPLELKFLKTYSMVEMSDKVVNLEDDSEAVVVPPRPVRIQAISGPERKRRMGMTNAALKKAKNLVLKRPAGSDTAGPLLKRPAGSGTAGPDPAADAAAGADAAAAAETVRLEAEFAQAEQVALAAEVAVELMGLALERDLEAAAAGEPAGAPVAPMGGGALGGAGRGNRGRRGRGRGRLAAVPAVPAAVPAVHAVPGPVDAAAAVPGAGRGAGRGNHGRGGAGRGNRGRGRAGGRPVVASGVKGPTGCSKCRWLKGCGTCRKFAADHVGNYSIRADGVVLNGIHP